MSDSRITVIREDVFTVDDVMSANECAAVIEHAERAGFEAATITTPGGVRVENDVRNNDRLIEDDHARAADLWGRLREFVPAFLSGRQAIGVNERFRTYRYHPGQRFRAHEDAPYRRPNGEQSLLTLMVYLNDSFEGGETMFRDTPVAPKTGMALLFRHELLHEGRAVTAGVKYVLRSDMMFNPVGRISA
jgi:predicted 2-oxoglutarate/Fe(II)-dependent dioxygenase YbiX